MTKRDGKPCKQCGTSEWYDGGTCKHCNREGGRRRDAEDPEKKREKDRKWQQQNRTKTQGYSQKYRNANREKVNRSRREYYARNPDRGCAASRKWQANHQERRKETERRYREENRDKKTAKENRRRTRKTQAGGSYTPQEWKDLCSYYGNICLCCGRDDVKLTADHVLPVSMGGSSNIDNIQPLCLSCNSRKQSRHIDYRNRSPVSRWIQRILF